MSPVNKQTYRQTQTDGWADRETADNPETRTESWARDIRTEMEHGILIET